MKIVFIGTFNPVTMAHLSMAQMVNNALDSEVMFVPTSDLYKKDSLSTSSLHRIKMLEIALSDNDKFIVDNIEINLADTLKRQPKTIETLYALKTKYEEDLVLLIGTDNFNDLDNWFKIEELIRNFKIVVYPRLGYTCDLTKHSLYQKYPERFIMLKTDLISNISSTVVRDNFKSQHSNKYLIKDEVIAYIMANKDAFDYWR